MKKIIRKINLVILRNEEWASFFRDFKQFVENTTAKVLKIERLFNLFLPLYALADDLIEQIRKSKITVRIADLDKLRDNTFHGLIYVIKSYRYHFDTIKAAAAKSLETIIDHYKDLACFRHLHHLIFDIKQLRSESYIGIGCIVGLLPFLFQQLIVRCKFGVYLMQFFVYIFILVD